MADEPNLPNPPSDDEISERLRQAVERASRKVDAEEDPFTALKREMADVPLGSPPESSQTAKVGLPDEDPEFADRFNKLNERVDSYRTKKATAAHQEGKRLKSEQESSRGMGLGLSIAYTIIGLPVVMALIGWLIDQKLQTTFWKGSLAFLGMIIGVFYAVTVLNKTNKAE